MKEHRGSGTLRKGSGRFLAAFLTVIMLMTVAFSTSACSKTGSVFDNPGIENDGKNGNAKDGKNDANSSDPEGSGYKDDGTDSAGDRADGQNAGNGNGKSAGNNNGSNPGNIGTNASGPDDVPSNHGFWAVNETENGYYYEYGQPYNTTVWFGALNQWALRDHRLCFYDKASGESILLCAKPDCEHNRDESCVATYKGIAVYNCLLYDGMLYLYGIETNDTIISECLWKVAPDGSYIDKLATLVEADNSADAQLQYHRNQGAMDSAFIIHRGCAYVPYFLMIGKGSMGFKGGGLMQVNLKTGEKHTIMEMKYHTDPAPSNLRGIGDYIYFSINSSNKDYGTHRYSIERNEITPLGSNLRPDGENAPETVEFYQGINFMMISDNYMFNFYPNQAAEAENNKYTVYTYDLECKGLQEKNFMVDIVADDAGTAGFRRYFCYDNKYIIIAVLNRVLVYSIMDDSWGEKLGEIDYELEYLNPGYNASYYQANQEVEFEVGNNKIYMLRDTSGNEFIVDPQTGFRDEDSMYPYAVYEAGIADIIAGNGEWKEAFRYYRGR